MTLLEDAPPRAVVRRRRVRRAGIVAAAVGVVAFGAVAVVHAVDAAALDRVHVFLAARSFVCATPSDATSVTTGDFEDDDDHAYRLPAVRGGPDLDCRMSVVVQNDSDRDLDIDRVLFPMYGPENGAGLHVDTSFTQGLKPASTGGSLDALFDYQHESPLGMAADSVTRLDYHLSWSDGCMDDGSFQTTPGAPVVTVSTGLATADRPLEGPGWAIEGTKRSLAARC